MYGFDSNFLEIPVATFGATANLKSSKSLRKVATCIKGFIVWFLYVTVFETRLSCLRPLSNQITGY